MMDILFKTIKNYISGERAYQNIKAITNCHRIQASPGFRDAAVYCAEELRKTGISCKVLSYPADGSTRYWTQQMFKEWTCEEAYLDIYSDEPQRLCDYSADAFSLIQRSMPLQFNNQPVDLVVMDKGSAAHAYADIDLKGKLLLIGEDYNEYLDWAIFNKGALGFVSDRIHPIKSVRAREDLYDTRMYQSFWYMSDKEVFSSGFVITPRQGDMLRELARKTKEAHLLDPSLPAYVQLTGQISSKLYAGEIEVVEATIPGETQEELIIVAHLCHPKASANDNASGVAGALEVFKTIHDLIQTHKIPALNRTLRLILVPEFTGTYAYLASRESDLSRILAGINLDMIGGNQSTNIVPITITDVPNAMPSFVHSVAAYFLDLVKQESRSLSGQDIPMFMSTLSDFVGGSDHYVMSDPTVGISCLMLGQWPDKYYHTSADTIDKIDPEILKRAIAIAAGYIYTLSNLSVDFLPILLNKFRDMFSHKISEIIQKAIVSQEAYTITAQRVQHACEVACTSIEDYKRFFTGENLAIVKRIIADERRYITRGARDLTERHQRLCTNNQEVALFDCIADEYQQIPVRVHRGPLQISRLLPILSADCQEYYHRLENKFNKMGIAWDTALYWANSKRSIGEIARKVFFDTGYDTPQDILAMFHFLEDTGFVRFK